MGFCGEAAAELGVRGHPAGDQDSAGVRLVDGGEGLLQQTADHGVLEAGGKVEKVLRKKVAASELGDKFGGGACGLRDLLPSAFGGGEEVLRLEMTEHGGLDAGEGEVEGAGRTGGGFAWRAGGGSGRS